MEAVHQIDHCVLEVAADIRCMMAGDRALSLDPSAYVASEVYQVANLEDLEYETACAASSAEASVPESVDPCAHQVSSCSYCDSPGQESKELVDCSFG